MNVSSWPPLPAPRPISIVEACLERGNIRLSGLKLGLSRVSRRLYCKVYEAKEDRKFRLSLPGVFYNFIILYPAQPVPAVIAGS